MRVAVDAMGGDHAPRVVVEGAVAASRESGVPVTLVGPSGLLQAQLSEFPDAARLDLRVVDADEAIGMGESPAQALRRKPRASVTVAADLVARGEAAAIFSAGNTGATVLAAHAAFGLLAGAERPALAATIPTARGVAVLVDVGGNANCRPQHLATFGVMGAVFARVAFGLESPAVGLLSIGEEATKGNELTREAHRLLRDLPLRFIGNVEARDVYSGEADVVVCDGFTGNVVIKVSEGMVEMVDALLTQEASAAGGHPASGALREAFQHVRRRVDYSEYGGAPLLGVGAACVVGHGRSSAGAVRNAVVLAHRFAAEGLVGRLARQLRDTQGASS
jgi:glycerol-3-phosphate acyltransferase PlsX